MPRRDMLGGARTSSRPSPAYPTPRSKTTCGNLHTIVSQSLPKKRREELGLDPD
jgi:hypothetical protein